MSRARTYTKSEIADAAAAAAMHDVRVIMHPTGEIEFSPRRFAVKPEKDDSAEAALNRWIDGRQTGGNS
ncbi:hypothetical protein G6L14_10805 [Agrobacterium vitis]|uniref:hypothetical protein n=1 Tax=Agrobacterium vitis TaxID=373 RepID=UPI001573B092|nr:hypothetical protein [Agrobacterium vitis]NSY12504.1 hypothetical protein [Agrobacterium vitis]